MADDSNRTEHATAPEAKPPPPPERPLKAPTPTSAQAVASALDLSAELRGDNRELPPDAAIDFIARARQADGPELANRKARDAEREVERTAADLLQKVDTENASLQRGDASTLGVLRNAHQSLLEDVAKLVTKHAPRVEDAARDPHLSRLGRPAQIEKFERERDEEIGKRIEQTRVLIEDLAGERERALHQVLAPPESAPKKPDPMRQAVEAHTRALARSDFLAATRDLDGKAFRHLVAEIVQDPLHPFASVAAEAAAVRFAGDAVMLDAIVKHARNVSSAQGVTSLLGDEGKLRAAVEISKLRELRSQLAAEVATLAKDPLSAADFAAKWKRGRGR